MTRLSVAATHWKMSWNIMECSLQCCFDLCSVFLIRLMLMYFSGARISSFFFWHGLVSTRRFFFLKNDFYDFCKSGRYHFRTHFRSQKRSTWKKKERGTVRVLFFSHTASRSHFIYVLWKNCWFQVLCVYGTYPSLHIRQQETTRTWKQTRQTAETIWFGRNMPKYG